jgi:NAD(P)-dependent dehydrogenase (short-subunit alcohol dehydrogenase family)
VTGGSDPNRLDGRTGGSDPNRLDGRTAVITGAASGIGRAVSRLFARCGASVVVADVDDAGGEETVALVGAEGGAALFRHTDVRSDDEVRNLMERAGAGGGLDVLVNVAGMLRSGPVTEFDPEDWNQLLAVNLSSCFLTARHAVPQIRRRGGGTIVNTASGAALKGFAGMSCYAATKGGVLAYTRALAAEVAGFGIRVNCVCPGWVDTPFNDPATEFMGGREKVDEMLAGITMLGRQSSPEEIAHTYLFLASDASSFMTNQMVVADGGMV